jgi:hypothetical protein
VGLACPQAFLGLPLGIVPAAPGETVEAKQGQCGDGRQGGAAVLAVADHPLQGLPAAGQPVGAGGSRAEGQGAPLVGFTGQVVDGGI